jgi:hypothetical protein
VSAVDDRLPLVRAGRVQLADFPKSWLSQRSKRVYRPRALTASLDPRGQFS